MLQRSLGSPTFAGFWQHWNPVFGYGLGRYVYGPLRRVLPKGLALVLTFTVSGAIHDLVTMAARGGAAFLFIPWFTLMGICVVLGREFSISFTGRSWWARASANVGYVALCLATVLAVKHQLQ